MMRVGFVLRLAFSATLLLVGWIVGNVFPAPPQLTNLFVQRSGQLAGQLNIENIDWQALKQRLSPEQFARMSRSAVDLAAKAGDAIVVEREGEPLEEHVDEIAVAAQAAPAVGFERMLALCPRMTVSNAPPADAARQLSNYAPVVLVNGVAIAAAPTREACLSSGFGVRNGRGHKGIDLHNGTGGPVLAAGAGVVIEKKYRNDYGNMLLIDHGRGVYTRYAHLSNFADGIVVGARVTAGQQIGLMGNTASYRIPVHLHYELLLGNYTNPRGSFGLTPHSPFEYARAT
jgi:murein DD-endopeptidase MepM/ murein hydrolase activator NlpD